LFQRLFGIANPHISQTFPGGVKRHAESVFHRL
jgi:hypothetical protein